MEIKVCGCGHNGRLGLGNSEQNVHTLTSHPFFVGDKAPVGIFCGGFHTFVLAKDGNVYGYGLNEMGQLGLSSNQPEFSRPLPVPFFSDKDLSLLSDTELAYHGDTTWLSGGQVVVAGDTYESALRDRVIAKVGTRSRHDAEVVIAIECGAYHTLVLTSKSLYACGANDKGQLGVGHFDNETSFVTVSLPVEDVLGHVVGVSCGPYHSGIIVRDGSIPTRLLMNTNSSATTNPTPLYDGGGDDEDMTVVPFSIMCCGAGDFGELGRNADEWEKLHAMEARVRNHVAVKSHHEQQGGSVGDVADFAPTTKSQPKFKIKGVVPVQRRDAFSSETFKRISFPFLDAYALDNSMPALSHIKLTCSLRHTSVTIDFAVSGRSRPPPRSFHWGCLYCDKVETDATSIPVEMVATPTTTTEDEDSSIVAIYGGEEVLLSVRRDNLGVMGDTLFIQGKGILGCGEMDDFCEEGMAIPIPSTIGPFEVLDICGKEHFLVTIRMLDVDSVVGGPSFIYAVLAFGDNFMGNLGVGSDDEVGDRVHVVCKSKDRIVAGAGFRHSVLLLHTPAAM